MSWETICPECGARLDPGEKCDCKKEMPPIDAATSGSISSKTKTKNSQLHYSKIEMICQGVCE